jgi:hypothetical protein
MFQGGRRPISQVPFIKAGWIRIAPASKGGFLLREDGVSPQKSSLNETMGVGGKFPVPADGLAPN